MGPIHTLDDVIDMVRRRAALMSLVICVGGFVSIWVALSQTDIFSSTEVIQIEYSEIAGQKPTETGSWTQRLQVINQRLLASDNLLDAIDEFELYSDDPGLRSIEKVDLLRQSTQIQGVGTTGGDSVDDGSVSALAVTVTMQNPEKAHVVSHEIALQIIELSARLRIEQARETLDFFILQEEKLSARSATLDARIAGYRSSVDTSGVGLPGSYHFEIAALIAAIREIDKKSIALQLKSDQIDSAALQATADRMHADFQREIHNLAAQKTMLIKRKQILESTPKDQRMLTEFVRQQEQLQGQLDETIRQLSAAEVGFRLESQRKIERLTVLEHATIADNPVNVSRTFIVMFGLAVSTFAAFFLALLFEYRNRVVRTASQMQRELGYPPIMSIPFLDGSQNRS